MLTVLPAFVLSLSSGRWTCAALLVPSLLFFMWNPGLFRGQERVPTRTLILLAAMPLLTAIYFLESWNYGLQYQGRWFTFVTCIVNVVWLAALWMIAAGRRRRNSFAGNLLLHWLLFAWLGWYAFPYLGELL
jgi:hypothetical protein